MNFDELKKIIENKNIEIPENNMEFFCEFTNSLTEKILDDWISDKIKEKNDTGN